MMTMADSGNASATTRTVHPWVTGEQASVRFGLVPVGTYDDWPAYLHLARTAETLGFDSFWVPDHPTGGCDCWTTLAALAAATARIRLGSFTSCVFYRSPALLARVAADVDRISGGRLVLGLGIGYDAEEFANLNVPLLSVRERQQALEETVHIMRGLWNGQPFTYQGAHFHVTGATTAPGPFQQPHVPLLIAGGGEKVTLRQVAQFADVANFGPHPDVGGAFTLQDVRRKYEVLRQYCEAAGRPYRGVLRTYIHLPILAETKAAAVTKVEVMPAGSRAYFGRALYGSSAAETIAHFQDLVAAGVQYFVLMLWPGELETLRLLGEQVIPALQSGNVAAKTAVSHSDRRRWLPWSH
jgi:alkanesulfonate monooxygenase SsuD/methylene tetrahydromethanopterin reductase-like flavin-dependent oxidoreductase (luciferase family)